MWTEHSIIEALQTALRDLFMTLRCSCSVADLGNVSGFITFFWWTMKQEPELPEEPQGGFQFSEMNLHTDCVAYYLFGCRCVDKAVRRYNNTWQSFHNRLVMIDRNSRKKISETFPFFRLVVVIFLLFSFLFFVFLRCKNVMLNLWRGIRHQTSAQRLILLNQDFPPLGTVSFLWPLWHNVLCRFSVIQVMAILKRLNRSQLDLVFLFLKMFQLSYRRLVHDWLCWQSFRFRSSCLVCSLIHATKSYTTHSGVSSQVVHSKLCSCELLGCPKNSLWS